MPYSSFLKLLVFAACGLLLPTQDAYAYLDPGTGSLILQAMVGGAVAVAATVGVYWQRTKRFFMRMFCRKNDNRSSSQPDD